ncbi:hypothetical protein HZA42_05445 [Candidatus Peregrinibacteria bacterium]|nr:hypothetical protein [Candidatus Peregrinibacteria bacterium]
MGRHTHALVHSPALDTEHLPAGFDPTIGTKHFSLSAQTATSVAIWIVSAITSWMGLTNYFGKGIDYVSETFQLGIPPALAITLRQSLILVSVAISQMVLKFKQRIEKVAHEENKVGTRTTIDVIKRSVRSHPVLAAIGGFLVVFDVGTNFNGFVTGVLQRKGVAEQITDAKRNIDGRKRSIGTQVEVVKAFPAAVDKQVKDILDAEAGGSSETAQAGKGPVYKAKECVYSNACGELDAACDPTNLDCALSTAIKDSGLTQDSQSMGQEVEAKANEKLAHLQAVLEKVDALTATLSPSSEIETLNDQLRQVTDSIAEAVAILNTDLPKDLKAHLAQYEAVSKQILQIAQRSGKYPRLQPDQLAKWEVPPVKVDTSKIEVGRFKFVGFEDLVPVMKEHLDGKQSFGLILLGVIIAFLSSYADLFTLSSSRKGYAKDRKEAADKKTEYFDYTFDKVVTLLASVLNRGPYSQFFKPGVAVDQRVVESAIRQRVDELATQPQDGKIFRLLGKVLPMEFFNKRRRGRTGVALDHNARIGALQQIVSSPEEMGAVLRSLMPGMNLVDSPAQHTTLKNVRTQNVTEINEANAKVQAEEIRGIQAEIRAVRAGVNPDTITMSELNEFVAQADASGQKLRTVAAHLYPGNEKLMQTAQGNLTSLHELLNQVLVNIQARRIAHVQGQIEEFAGRLNPSILLKDWTKMERELGGIYRELRGITGIFDENEESNRAANFSFNSTQTGLQTILISIVDNLASNTHVLTTMNDGELSEITDRCTLWRQELVRVIPNEVLATLPGEDQTRYLTIIDTIEGVLRDVDTIRDGRRRSVAEARRVNQERRDRDALESTLRSVDTWYSTRGVPVSENTGGVYSADRITAENLGILLGERNLIGVSGQIEDRGARQRLETQFAAIQGQLALAKANAAQMDDQGQQVQYIEQRSAALTTDMEVLRRHFAA